MRNQRQQVELNIAVLFGRAKTGVMRGHSDITVLSSDEFWARISGISDFRARLLRATTIVAWLVSAVQRRRQSGLSARRELFGDEERKLDLEALANAPRTQREEQELRDKRLLASLDLL